MKTGSLLLVALLAAAPLGAQATLPQAVDSAAAHAAGQTSAEVQHGTATATEHGPASAHAGGDEACGTHDPSDIITPHITDSHCLEVPGFPKFWEPREVALPRWAPIHIGSLALDMSPTKHVVMMLLAALLSCLILIGAARVHVRHTHSAGHPKGFAAGNTLRRRTFGRGALGRQRRREQCRGEYEQCGRAEHCHIVSNFGSTNVEMKRNVTRLSRAAGAGIPSSLTATKA